MMQAEIKINLYEVDELQERAKQKALENIREFELSILSVSDFIGCGDPELDTPESMYEEDYNDILLNDERVLEDIRANEYLFFDDGRQAHITHYCKNHPQYPGEKHLKLAGRVYKIGG